MSFFSFNFWAMKAHLFFVFEAVCLIGTVLFAESSFCELVVSKADFTR
ncbi:hypothetical protein A1Q_3792 [Vibrio campbellii HY01]|nr:hypothetical protein A1Q_3792 [Vibrio campbellii HY01]